MDVNNNSYTIGFATFMVILVAALLSSVYIGLKPLQSKNVEQEKKQNILRSVGVEISREQAEIDYYNYIKEELVINHLGEIQEGSAFDVELSKELRKDINSQSLPLYVAEINSEKKYIIPLRGKGLWGPIWGFISLNNDYNTVYAAVFDHKAETPGLGAEINIPAFMDQFKEKNIMKNNEFVSVKVVKKDGQERDSHNVDGISGGTITSDGVSEMIYERVSKYIPYFNSKSTSLQVQSTLSFVTNDELNDTISNISKRIID